MNYILFEIEVLEVSMSLQKDDSVRYRLISVHMMRNRR
jgi:hypothetical protein